VEFGQQQKEVNMTKKLFILAILLLLSLPTLAKSLDTLNPDSIPFAPAVNYGAGVGPRSVFCADLDGDTDLDLAVANGASNNVSILKNNGNGTFQSAVNYGAGDYPFSVFCADLDGDTDLDLAVANCGSFNVSILKNNGDGTFQTAVNYGAGVCPHSVFCADLDGDTDLDLAVANSGSFNVSILKNNGNGTFQTAVNYGAGDSPSSVFCADLDGDTDLDLAVANLYGNNVSILKNNGDGTFQTAVNYGAGNGPSSVFCADLDGDTDLDLAVANGGSGSVSILKNNGDGTFQTKVDYGALDSPVSVFCADLDGDLVLDLAVGNYWLHKVSILKNNGDGTFQNRVNYDAGERHYSVFCADLDGDSDLDLAVTNSFNNNVSILINLTNSLPSRVLLLKDGSASHNPIPNKSFKIYKVTNNPPDMTETYLGELTTDGNGRITLPGGWFNVGEWIKVEKIVRIEPTDRTHHEAVNNVKFYETIDNGKFNTDTGNIYFDAISGNPEQELILDHTTVMYNLVVAVEWEADREYLDSLINGLRYVSNYLYDVTDGQLALGKVAIYDDSLWHGSADVQVCASNYLGEITGGAVAACCFDIIYPRISYTSRLDGDRNRTYDLYPYSWTIDQVSYNGQTYYYAPIRVLAHEFGHYAMNLLEEWSLSAYRFGMMIDPALGTDWMNLEMSDSLDYVDLTHRDTQQWTVHGRSCWDNFESGFQGAWAPANVVAEIIKPRERGLAVDRFRGPNDVLTNPTYDVGNSLDTLIFDFQGNAFTYGVCSKDGLGFTIPNSKVTLIKTNTNRVIEQGRTADNGWIRCLGVNDGDKIRSTNRLGIWIPFLCGELVVNSSGVSRFSNLYRAFNINDSAEIIMRSVQGNYLMNNAGVFDGENSLRYNLRLNKFFYQNPTLEFYSPSGQIYNYNFSPVANGYEVTIGDSLGSSGMFSVIAVDDSGYSFFVNNSYTVTYLSDSFFSRQIYGPQGSCELALDTLNTSLGKIFILSSDFPPLLNGLDSSVEEGGSVHSICAYPNISNLNGANNYLAIRYSDIDLKNSPETSLKIFKWDETSNEWKFVGGSVDTVRNEVVECIQSLGIYATFTTALARGDVDNDGHISLADIIYLANYVLKGGPAPNPIQVADLNCDGKYDLVDVIKLARYVLFGEPFPC
jgi:hypothetical protein